MAQKADQQPVDELARRYSRIIMIAIRATLLLIGALPVGIALGLSGAPFAVVVTLILVGSVALLAVLIFAVMVLDL